MRVAIRGRGTPGALSAAIQQFVERLERAGVDGVVGASLYLRPLIGDEEAKFFSVGRKELDILESEFFSSGDESSTDENEADPIEIRSLSDGRLLVSLDFVYCSVFLQRSDRIGVPREFLRRYLADMDRRRWSDFCNEDLPELTDSEREYFRKLVWLYWTADYQCGSEDAMVEWFMGPYPHSKLEGETPAEQLMAGGFAAVEILTKDLDAFARSKGPAAGVPPRHYDLQLKRQ